MKRDASALLITRTGDLGLEVFLAERSPKLRFFGGYFALPGGVRNPEDGVDIDGDDSEPLHRCAIRELFEETGIVRLTSPPPAGTVADLRREMLDRERERKKAPFEAWVRWTEAAAAEPLRALCRIQTPPFAPVRYDTVFYHVPLRANERPEIVHGELIGGGFFRPQQALDAWRRGEIRIVPPVLIVLQHLADAAFEAAAEQLATTAQSYRQGRLHQVRFSPGIVLAPLKTPTLPPATTTNCLLVGEERMVAIDPGSPDPTEQQRLETLIDDLEAEGRRLDAIVLTHHHPDHTGGVAALSQARGLPVHAHPTTLARLPTGARPGRSLDDGDILELGSNPAGDGSWHLRAVFTPGHDRGHLAFVDSRYGAVIAGDMVSTVSTIVIDPPEGHLRTYLASLRRLRQEELSTLYPAHGPAVPRGRTLVDHYLEHRAQRETALVDALGDTPRSVEDLVGVVYWDAPEALHGVAARSLLAGLQKLEEDGVAQPFGAEWVRTG